MSDTFDHEGDAWASLDDYLNDGAGPVFGFNGWTICRHCLKSTKWKLTEGGWRLANSDGSTHNCLVKAASVDEFEDVDDATDPAP